MSSHVWIIEFKLQDETWIPSSYYDTAYTTRKEAFAFLKKQGEKGPFYRVSRYNREGPAKRD